MTTKELYTKGAKIWVRHPELVWETATVTEHYSGSTLQIVIDESQVSQEIVIKNDNDLPPLRNPDILLGENDLTSLSYLHEPAVLHNLQVRFCQNKSIYTYCGIVLVAVNPYAELPLYGQDSIAAYRGHSLGDLEPHIFAVAEEAYAKLEREARDQSIIVSGESGAGKTVSAKYAMRYFACVGGSDKETQVERKVLASSPIMEAIGNAKTTRNDNSSRFGKFIELRFNKHLHITGASMRTYLLEKSRVVFQASGERNYHIFYQLCSSRKEMPFLYLDHQDNFNYLNQGECPDIQGISDSGSFSETRAALTTLGFSTSEQEDMFKVWSAVLHLGNINFLSTSTNEESDTSSIPSSDKHLEHFCNLLDIEIRAMQQWLCIRQIISMNDVIQKPMSQSEAQNSRDALAKHIYAKLFEYVVKTINKTLESSGKTKQCIGVLDIYGFETFEINSFEQFCINYANEKLQQQFNKHVFKLEQQEYLKEGIAWKMIDFYDNQPCIDLIESRLGILDLLDEECKMPRGSDSSWTEKLYSKCAKHTHFNKPRFGTSAFVIHHFADKVEYESVGFLEKNRDTVMEQQIGVLKRSNNSLVRELFSIIDQAKKATPKVKVKVTTHIGNESVTSKQNKKSVGSQFRESLGLLMSTLDATTPHYVRCIKPNDGKLAFTWEASRAVQQLRACGVLETIRISAAGFPSRWCYIDFFARYRVLCHSKDVNRSDMIATCKIILVKCIKDSDKYQFGKTMIFFRAGQVAYLEKLRADQLSRCCIIMQSQMRAFVKRKLYLKLKKSIMGIQRHGRGLLGRRKAVKLRQQIAAITIQKYVRKWIARKKFLDMKATALFIQRYGRAYLARLRYKKLLYDSKAIMIQKHVRGWLARRHYKSYIRKIIICQSAIRRKLARKRFRALKAEARSVEHVKTLNRGLENKIISLQQKIEELNKKNTALNAVLAENQDLKSKLGTLRSLENELKRLTLAMDEKDRTLKDLDDRLRVEQDEKMQIVEERQQLEVDMNNEIKILKDEIFEVKQKNKTLETVVEENVQKRFEDERSQHNDESERQRAAYQKLLLEYHALETRAESMQEQLARSTRIAHFSDSSNMIEDCQISSGSPSEDDYGYGSVRSMSTTQHTKLDSIDWKKSDQYNENLGSGDNARDVGLILKLQQKLHMVEMDRTRLSNRIEELEKGNVDYKSFEDGIRSAELEIENEKLRNDLMLLRQTMIDRNFSGVEKKEIIEQFKVCQEERDRRRDECIQLRTVLATQSTKLRSLGDNYPTDDLSIVNEDGELIHAFESQKKIIRQLESELQTEKNHSLNTKQEMGAEIDRLIAENERLEKLLQGNLGPAQTKMEAYMQYEITRLTSENLNLQEAKDTLSNNFQKLKAQMQILTKRLTDNGLSEYLEPQQHTTVTNIATVGKDEIRLPHIKKKDREYLGMFEYKFEDENIIIKRLVTDLKPRVAATLLPCLPAYIVFMCIRYTDMINNDIKVRSIIQSFLTATRKTMKKHTDNLDYRALWLANMLRLLHNLKQYSGDVAFQIKNTPKQNDQCLLNFDLSDHRQMISDFCFCIYQDLITHLQEKLQPLIIPAILEHEAISGLTSHKPAGMRGRSSSVSADNSKNAFKAPEQLVSELTDILKTLGYYGVDPEIIVQIFRQLFYFICGTSLNNLLLRKDLCHWSKGMQIRYNLSHLETWTRDHKLEEGPILSTLQPIIQAAQLLQARKSDDDVQSVCDMCSQLTTTQICKILNLYTPADGYEEKVSIAFIRKIQEKLQKRNNTTEKDILLMDLKNTFPIKFPFNPSSIRLEDIEVPEVLKLEALTKI